MAEKILAVFAAIALFFVVAFIGYQEFGTSKVVVEVQLKKGEDPFQTLRTLLPEDSAVLDVREIDRNANQYELTIKTHKKKHFLLEWMRRSSRVERAEECQR